MLQQLTIRDFAIIHRLEVEWSGGLNVITGETGAGKSIIVDAVGALLGDRMGPEMVRTGADRAAIEGIFSVAHERPPALAQVLEEFGLEVEDGALILSREIAGPGGRGGGRVNGRAVPLAVLQQLGEQLVDVHGQSQHMALLRTREHLEYLDRYAGLLPERAQVAVLARSLRALRGEVQALQAEERQAAREQEMLRHELAEIERAELCEDEDEELEARRTRLRHVERLRQSAMSAYQALAGREAEETERPGAVELLGVALAAGQDGARYDPILQAEVDLLADALARSEDAARALQRYLDGLEADPRALLQTEERLLQIGDLKRRYGDTVREVLAYAAEARARLERYENREAHLTSLAADERRLVAELGVAASALSAQRRAAGERLARAVEGELADLQMPHTRFRVDVVQVPDPAGVPFEHGPAVQFDQSGVDRVEFLISPNAGEEPRSMARIASGGELARIALALKTILSQADTRATLIFDEVDTGVGGRTAPVVGQKLWGLAAHGHQVLCVTHMPQVAAFGDTHWGVAKRTDGSRTTATIAPLEGDARVDELAAMLAGSLSESARSSAADLLARAAAFQQAEAGAAQDSEGGAALTPPAASAAPGLQSGTDPSLAADGLDQPTGARRGRRAVGRA